MKINWFNIEIKNTIKEFYFAIKIPYFIDINYLINYLKMGKICEDCTKIYHECNCNNYEEITESICEYNIEKRTMVLYELAMINLSKNNLIKLNESILIRSESYLNKLKKEIRFQFK